MFAYPKKEQNVIRNVLFDLDDTLFDFHRAEAEAIRHTLAEIGIDPTDETVALDSRINRSCWAKLETGEYTREEVLHRRFDMLFETLGVTGDAHETQKIYEYRLSLGAYYLDGAEELLDAVFGKYRLYLATNGIVNVQSRRINDSGVLLALIGGGMIKEALEKKEEGCDCCNQDASLGAKVMFPMAIATSIDAMVVGVGYGLRPDMTIPKVLLSVILIGVITFALSALGVKIGNVFGDKYERKAQLAGGIVLCLLGVKNVLDQYGVLDAVWGWISGLFA